MRNDAVYIAGAWMTISHRAFNCDKIIFGLFDFQAKTSPVGGERLAEWEMEKSYIGY